MNHRERDIQELIGIPRKPGRPRKPAPAAGTIEAQLNEARLRRTIADAEKIELETSRRTGELLDAATVERAWTAILRDTKAALLAIPGRLAPHLTKTETALVDREIRAALRGLADGN